MKKKLDRKLSVAPMMDYTDRHCRYFLRLCSPSALLYTEMVTTGAILNGDKNYLLDFHVDEHPVAIQLGGSDPKELVQCAKICEDWGYDEINLNIGCPSDRVQQGRIGVCLMPESDLVAECIAKMQAHVDIPVTVKTRIGVDDQDSYEFFENFVKTVSQADCDVFIVHARKAWLQGLSPKQNRDIPPLQYDMVKKIKKDYPDLTFVLNGGVQTEQDILDHWDELDGVMIGREAYKNPYMLTELEKHLQEGDIELPTRQSIAEDFIPYLVHQIEQGVHIKHMTRHILGLFHAQPGARTWRQLLSNNLDMMSAEDILAALKHT